MSASVDIVIEFGLPLLASVGIAFLVLAAARSGHLARLMQRRGPSSGPEGGGQTGASSPVPEGTEARPPGTPSALRALVLLLGVVLVLWGVVRVLV